MIKEKTKNMWATSRRKWKDWLSSWDTDKREVSTMFLPPFSPAGAPAIPSKSQKAKAVTGGMKNHTL